MMNLVEKLIYLISQSLQNLMQNLEDILIEKTLKIMKKTLKKLRIIHFLEILQ